MENLTCIYVFVEDEPLRCTWNAPTNLTDTIRIYNVEVKYNDQVLHSGTTAGTSYKKTPEFRAYPKYVYEVTVTAMTDIIGSPTSTSLKFLHSGVFNSHLILLFLYYFARYIRLMIKKSVNINGILNIVKHELR